MNTEEANLNQLVDELDARDVKERRVLTQLMDKYSQQKGKAFALRSEMGYTLEETGQKVRIPSFVMVQKLLDWVGKEIKMGSEMPFMQSHLDEEGASQGRRINSRKRQAASARFGGGSRRSQLIWLMISAESLEPSSL